MYALWGSELAARLHAPELRTRLAALGATELQLNIADAEVASALLRLSTYDEPIAALVSVRIPSGEFAAVTEVLSSVTDRVAGWIVAERVPLAPPRAASGVRVDALANIAMLRIPADMSREEWRHRWQDQHTTVAIETQATFGYVQNTVIETIAGDGKPVDALVEELFPMAALTDPHAFYGSGGDKKELHRRVIRMIESTSEFGANVNIDVIPTSRYIYNLTP